MVNLHLILYQQHPGHPYPCKALLRHPRIRWRMRFPTHKSCFETREYKHWPATVQKQMITSIKGTSKITFPSKRSAILFTHPLSLVPTQLLANILSFLEFEQFKRLRMVNDWFRLSVEQLRRHLRWHVDILWQPGSYGNAADSPRTNLNIDPKDCESPEIAQEIERVVQIGENAIISTVAIVPHPCVMQDTPAGECVRKLMRLGNNVSS